MCLDTRPSLETLQTLNLEKQNLMKLSPVCNFLESCESSDTHQNFGWLRNEEPKPAFLHIYTCNPAACKSSGSQWDYLRGLYLICLISTSLDLDPYMQILHTTEKVTMQGHQYPYCPSQLIYLVLSSHHYNLLWLQNMIKPAYVLQL